MTRGQRGDAIERSIERYYEELAEYATQRVSHELAVRTAFQNLLADAARKHGWTLIPELSSKAGDSRIRPDGTVRDANGLPRGYWEAKDRKDDLDVEIAKKRNKGYSVRNTIFENTKEAVLFQDGKPALKARMADADQLAELLETFFRHVEPNIASFEEAVETFKERVPDLARGLVAKIETAHRENRKFQSTYDVFYALCKTALNPNISTAAVDEMLVQHLLTERLISRIFDNPDFAQRNVIAAEVEKVISALVSKSFNRTEYLQSLNNFYVAIERAAETLTDYSDKQHFLNAIYERFFQGYSVRVADTHGIVYTPQPVVDFMCASIEHVLNDTFGTKLGDGGVNLLDPATGTGNFVVNLLRRIPRRLAAKAYSSQLFANEVMLLPYYVASLNVEHAYYELMGSYEPFEGLCFVDTLDLDESHQAIMAFLTAANTSRVERQRRTPITVVVGNPPYNADQINENDNNKNRKYKIIDSRIRDTYAKESVATLKNKLYDPYVKFFRWATDRLRGKDGVVCFITNNSFVLDGPPFDGMRAHLERDFNMIYHLDLHGDVSHNPKLSGTVHNVFGIRLGVGVTVAVRSESLSGSAIYYHRVPEGWTKEEKYSYLAETGSIAGVDWKPLKPTNRHAWIATRHERSFEALVPIASRAVKAAKRAIEATAVFKNYSPGAKTNRDEVVYDFDRQALQKRVKDVIESYNSEVDRYKRARCAPEKIDDFVDYARAKWSSGLKAAVVRLRYGKFNPACIRVALYRPFTKKYLYYDDLLNDRPGISREALPDADAERENRLICCTNHSQTPFLVQATNHIPNEAVGGRAGSCLPFYLYDAETGKRRENVTEWALERFRKHYQDNSIGKWDVFCYVYAVLHHEGYRARFAQNLRQGLPHIPLAPDFDAFAKSGRKLVDLHVGYEKVKAYDLKWREIDGRPFSTRVDEHARLLRDKLEFRVNDSLTIAGIPARALEYKLGNRSALEWFADQYRVGDESGDPNAFADDEYVAQLLGRVTQVSLDTVDLIESLPKDFGL